MGFFFCPQYCNALPTDLIFAWLCSMSVDTQRVITSTPTMAATHTLFAARLAADALRLELSAVQALGPAALVSLRAPKARALPSPSASMDALPTEGCDGERPYKMDPKNNQHHKTLWPNDVTRTHCHMSGIATCASQALQVSYCNVRNITYRFGVDLPASVFIAPSVSPPEAVLGLGGNSAS